MTPEIIHNQTIKYWNQGFWIQEPRAGAGSNGSNREKWPACSASTLHSRVKSFNIFHQTRQNSAKINQIYAFVVIQNQLRNYCWVAIWSQFVYDLFGICLSHAVSLTGPCPSKDGSVCSKIRTAGCACPSRMQQRLPPALGVLPWSECSSQNFHTEFNPKNVNFWKCVEQWNKQRNSQNICPCIRHVCPETGLWQATKTSNMHQILDVYWPELMLSKHMSILPMPSSCWPKTSNKSPGSSTRPASSILNWLFTNTHHHM